MLIVSKSKMKFMLIDCLFNLTACQKYKKQPLHFFVKLVVYSAALTKV